MDGSGGGQDGKPRARVTALPFCQRPGGCGQSCVGRRAAQAEAGNGDVFPTLRVGLKLCLEPDHLGLDLACYVIY